VLEAPERNYASGTGGPRRAAGALRRDLQEDYAQEFDRGFGARGGVAEDGFGAEGMESDYDDAPSSVRRRAGVRGGSRPGSKWLGWLPIPKTLWGRIAAGVGSAIVLGLGVAGVLAVRAALLHDERFVIPASSAIAVEGNRHVTKAQLLSIFGGDVERNILTVSLAERRAELERLPWVEHATVMRLLPDHLRVSIVERTPVAFVRQGGHIGLVDKSGVLMDMVSGANEKEHYSFPVVTGITADEPLSTRAARMKIFERFTTELDSAGTKISDELSEVDLSSPEDVKALIPDDHGEVLVHFGDTDFLDRYQKYKDHLAEWRTQYPKLAAVDMRYDRQAVLEMQPGSAVPVGGGQAADGPAAVTSSGKTDAAKSAGGGARVAVPASHAPAGHPATAAKPAAPAARPTATAAKPTSKAASTGAVTGAVKDGNAGSSPASGSGTGAASVGAQSVPQSAGSVPHHLTVAKNAPAAKKVVGKKPAARKKKVVAKKAVSKWTAAKKPGGTAAGSAQSSTPAAVKP
jgi:cell division protein FtsQ